MGDGTVGELIAWLLSHLNESDLIQTIIVSLIISIVLGVVLFFVLHSALVKLLNAKIAALYELLDLKGCKHAPDCQPGQTWEPVVLPERRSA